MGRTILLFFAFLTSPGLVCGTHLVGGEFEMLHLENNLYLFRQIQYFDVVNGNPIAEDSDILASIFRKRDNLFVRSMLLVQRRRELVEYTNPVCSNDRLITRRIEYESVVELEPGLFSDPEGYYVVWERCCRNNIITNIVSPDQTGQTFYLEFPAIVRQGKPFINSSPQLFPPLSDYACVGRSYYADFRGKDIDGDSLVYHLVTPFNVHDPGDPVPVPQPLPIPPVQWTAGITNAYQVPGNPTLNISPDGILRVTPIEEGLFVFSVQCVEYRNGVRIGEVRRDFQLFVIDCVPPGEKPKLMVKGPGQADFADGADTLEFAFEDTKCVEFEVADPDGGEHLNLMAEAVNFDGFVQGILSEDSVFVNNSDDAMGFQVCLPDCPFLREEPYVVDIMALDGTCPQPQRDTVRLVVSSALPPNTPAVFTVPAADRLSLQYSEGDIMQLAFSVTDAEGDSIEVFLGGREFDVSEYGITLDTLKYEAGAAEFVLRWDFDCRTYDFNDQRNFELTVYAEDRDQCAWDDPDSIVLDIEVRLPPNNPPVLAVDGSEQPGLFEAYIEEAGIVQVQVSDLDITDSLSLKAQGVGFELADVGMTLGVTEGTSPLTTSFTWQIGCFDVNLNTTDTLLVAFIAEDSDYCKVPSADTLFAYFQVLPPKNNAPRITIDPMIDGDIEVFAGRQVHHMITGTDLDNDALTMRIIEGGDFLAALDLPADPVQGQGVLEVPFSWRATCDMLSEDFASGSYEFVYVLEDQQCINPMSDTLAFTVQISDYPSDYDFLPPNVFTPNAVDAINAYYYIPDLPVDNCRSQFEQIVIINRWGREIFSSTDRDFEWHGIDVSNGVYYYQLKFSNKAYKGTISVIR